MISLLRKVNPWTKIALNITNAARHQGFSKLARNLVQCATRTTWIRLDPAPSEASLGKLYILKFAPRIVRIRRNFSFFKFYSDLFSNRASHDSEITWPRVRWSFIQPTNAQKTFHNTGHIKYSCALYEPWNLKRLASINTDVRNEDSVYLKKKMKKSCNKCNLECSICYLQHFHEWALFISRVILTITQLPRTKNQESFVFAHMCITVMLVFTSE